MNPVDVLIWLGIAVCALTVVALVAFVVALCVIARRKDGPL